MKKILFVFIGLYSSNAFAYYTETIQNQCGVIDNNLIAVFTPIPYTCPSGEFLPAYTLGCEPCPDDFICSGGTYNFSDNTHQGATLSSNYIKHDMTNMCATNILHELIAIFTPNVHTCTPGYYLPANIDVCTICPQNSFCSGGTFTFNETLDQGIFPHILHVGNDIIYLKSEKQTTPSLNIKIGNDVFYAHMTQNQTYMNNASEHYLKIQYDNNLYYVCDDTTCPQQ